MTRFLTGYQSEVIELVRALGVDRPEEVARVVLDIPCDGVVTLYVQRHGAFDVPSAIKVLDSIPFKLNVLDPAAVEEDSLRVE